MADSFYVTLDMDRIRRRLKWSDGVEPTFDDLRAWLRANDFVATLDGDVWVAEEVTIETALVDGDVRGMRRLA